MQPQPNNQSHPEVHTNRVPRRVVASAAALAISAGVAYGAHEFIANKNEQREFDHTLSMLESTPSEMFPGAVNWGDPAISDDQQLVIRYYNSDFSEMSYGGNLEIANPQHNVLATSRAEAAPNQVLSIIADEEITYGPSDIPTPYNRQLIIEVPKNVVGEQSISLTDWNSVELRHKEREGMRERVSTLDNYPYALRVEWQDDELVIVEAEANSVKNK